MQDILYLKFEIGIIKELFTRKLITKEQMDFAIEYIKSKFKEEEQS